MNTCTATRRRASVLFVATLAVLATLGSVALAAYGDLSQPDGDAGCANLDASDGCGQGRAVTAAEAIAYSVDGETLYVGSEDGIAVFDRDISTGAIDQKDGEAACIAADSSEGCAVGRALENATDLVVSPDGENLYSVDVFGNSIAVLDIAEDGSLSQRSSDDACVLDSDSAVSGCEAADDLRGPATLAIAPDGGEVFVGTTFEESVISLNRGSDGGLDVASEGESCISGEERDGCRLWPTVAPSDLAVSPDGQTLYAPGYKGLAVVPLAASGFDTDPLSDPGAQVCITNDGDATIGGESVADRCDVAPVLTGGDAGVVSSDGENVYVSVAAQNAIAAFDREAGATGELTPMPGKDSCLSADTGGSEGSQGCAAATEIAGEWLAIAPDGSSLYTGGESLGSFPQPPSRSVSNIDRNRRDGSLRQSSGTSACFASNAAGRNPVCRVARNIDYAYGGAVSPDGTQLATANFSDASGLAVFARSLIAVQVPRTLTLRAKPASVRKGDKVTFTGRIAAPQDPALCAARQRVRLDNGATPGSALTNAAGRFSIRAKPTRTKRYSVVVRLSGNCQYAESEPVRVTVKKRRRG